MTAGRPEAGAVLIRPASQLPATLCNARITIIEICHARLLLCRSGTGKLNISAVFAIIPPAMRCYDLHLKVGSVRADRLLPFRTCHIAPSMVVTIAINGPARPGPHETSTQCLHSSPSVSGGWCVENDSLFCLTEFLFHFSRRAMKLSCSTKWPRYSSGSTPELPGSIHARYFGIFQNRICIEEAEQLLACTADIIREIDVPPPCSRYSFTMSVATTS